MRGKAIEVIIWNLVVPLVWAFCEGSAAKGVFFQMDDSAKWWHNGLRVSPSDSCERMPAIPAREIAGESGGFKKPLILVPMGHYILDSPDSGLCPCVVPSLGCEAVARYRDNSWEPICPVLPSGS
jgi:hypothetical protein